MASFDMTSSPSEPADLEMGRSHLSASPSSRQASSTGHAGRQSSTIAPIGERQETLGVETDNEVHRDQTDEGGGDGPPLPPHLANLDPERREALQRRMQRELALDEARTSQPRRRIDRNAKQLYCTAACTSVFLILLLVRIHEEIKVTWHVIFIPLLFQYASLFALTSLEVRDCYRQWLLHREGRENERFSALKQMVSKSHESMWHLTCLVTAPVLATHLDHPSALSLTVVFIPVWLYGGISVSLGISYLMKALMSQCAHEPPVSLSSSFAGWIFALMVRVLPVLLIMRKLQGASYSWTVAFTPLWISIGFLGLLGTCVCCVVPVLVVTQEAAGRILGYIISIASLFLLIPAASSLAFLLMFVDFMSSRDEAKEDGYSSKEADNRAEPSLIEVFMPLFVMYLLLSILTPFLVRVVNSMHSVLDAMNQTGAPPDAHEEDPGKRPGEETALDPEKERPRYFVRRTSTLFVSVEGKQGDEQKGDLEQGVDCDDPFDRGNVSPHARLEGQHSKSGAEAQEQINTGASSSSAASSSSEALCFVCFEAPRNAILSPCGHGGMCYGCARDLAQTKMNHSDAPPRCPLCRATVREVLKLRMVEGAGQEDKPASEGACESEADDAGRTFVAEMAWRVGGASAGEADSPTYLLSMST